MSAAVESSPERLLRAELETLVPVLRRLAPHQLDLRTACPAWSVRDVVGHCGAALIGLTAGAAYRASHDQNQRDVEGRRSWSWPEVVDEFELGLNKGGPAIREAGGAKDLAALGTWIHGGDVRQAVGLPDAYRSEGFEDALETLARCERVIRTPCVHVTLPDRELVLGTETDGRAPARLTTDVSVLIRLYSGRPVDTERYRLTGARTEELISAEW